MDLTNVFDLLNDPNILCDAAWILETRSSKEITADLKDFVGGNFNLTPVIEVNDDEVCEGEAGTLTVSIYKDVDSQNPIADPLAAGYSIAWTGPGGFTANTVTINPTVEGDYTVTVSAGAFCDETRKRFFECGKR